MEVQLISDMLSVRLLVGVPTKCLLYTLWIGGLDGIDI